MAIVTLGRRQWSWRKGTYHREPGRPESWYAFGRQGADNCLTSTKTVFWKAFWLTSMGELWLCAPLITGPDGFADLAARHGAWRQLDGEVGSLEAVVFPLFGDGGEGSAGSGLVQVVLAVSLVWICGYRRRYAD